MPDAVEMTPAEYARHAGVSRQAIDKAMKAGKIPFRQRGGQKIIDAAAADLARGENRERFAPEDEAASTRPRHTLAQPSALTQAKTAGEIYGARLAQLKYERELGKLVSAAGVADAAATCGEAVVRIVRQLSQKADELAGVAVKDGPQGVRMLLRKIEHDQLTRIGAVFAEMAGAATAADAAGREAEQNDAGVGRQEDAIV